MPISIDYCFPKSGGGQGRNNWLAGICMSLVVFMERYVFFLAEPSYFPLVQLPRNTFVRVNTAEKTSIFLYMMQGCDDVAFTGAYAILRTACFEVELVVVKIEDCMAQLTCTKKHTYALHGVH